MNNIDISNDKEILDKIEEVKDLEKKIVNVAINPETGENVIDPNFNDESISIDELLEEGIIEGLDDISKEKEIEFDELKNAINNNDEEDKFNISDEATIQLLKVVNEYKKNKNINIYKAFPEEIQKMVDRFVINMGIPLFSNEGKRMKNTASLMLIDQYIKSIEMNRITKSLNSELKDIYDKSKGEITDSIVKYTKERNNKYREIAENIEDEEKKKKILLILDTIDETNKLTKLKEFSKKCKIKKIEIDKPHRVFTYILSKYEKSSYNIYDINICIPILYRNLNEDLENIKYSMNDVLAFLICFCKQCMNMKVENIEDHTYIYYTLYNIILMDMNKGEEKLSSNEMKESIKEIINNLKIRNSSILK